jgi:putative ABC transport system permease protein
MTTTVAPFPTASGRPVVMTRANGLHRWRTMARIGLRMMVHDKIKFIGTLIGVVFAVVLVNQQGGTGLGILDRNVMYVDHAGADVWVMPAGTRTLQPGKLIEDTAVTQARAMPEVAWAEPILYGATTLSLPSGATEQVTLVGSRAPDWHGGPFNVVAGNPQDFGEPDAMTFEDSDREKFGGLNLGSVREMNGRRVKAAAFTWGLVPFGTGGSYAFAEYDFARELLDVASDQVSFVLVGVKPGADILAVKNELQARVPSVRVLTREEFRLSCTRYVFFETPVGITLASSIIVALIVGFLVVGLMMFSAVIDNLREFGTLKAIGATTFDLVRLLWMQAAIYGFLGSFIGLALVSQMGNAARKPTLAMQLPPGLLVGTFIGAVLMCVLASSFAALRVRSLEPAMVFR